jgi:hypothetical protein
MFSILYVLRSLDGDGELRSSAGKDKEGLGLRTDIAI